jgi:hypothetical protein
MSPPLNHSVIWPNNEFASEIRPFYKNCDFEEMEIDDY